MPSVSTVNSLTRHLLLEEPQLSFSLGSFLDFEPGQEQLMIDAVQDLYDYLVYIRDNQAGGDLTGAQAQQSLVLAWTLLGTAGAAPRA